MAFFTRSPDLTLATLGDPAAWQQLAYVFELRYGRRSEFRPILLGPSSVTIQRNFAKHLEVAHNGGVHIAEYGMITGRITVVVETGVRARANRNPVTGEVHALSGLGRYFLIRDEILDVYSEALRAADLTGEAPTLVFHSLKDSESYVVAPDTFTLQRTLASPLSSPYTVVLDILAEDDRPPNLARDSPDRSILERISDSGREIRRAVQNARASVAELTAYTSQVRQASASWAGILSDAAAVVDAASDFVGGVRGLMDVPRSFVAGVVGTLEAFRELSLDVATTPAAIVQWWADLADQLDVIASYPETYVESLDDAISGRQSRQAGSAGYSGAELAAASGSIGGTGARPSDGTRAAGGMPAVDAAPAYSGWVEVPIRASDTAAGLAARFGAHWPDVAAANRLRPPYFSEAMLPHTVGPGARIIVPAAFAAGRAFASRATPAAPLGDSMQDEVFGVDLLLHEVEGVAIDTDHGSTDFARIAGADNVVQAVGLRLGTFQGDNLAYPAVGIPYQPGETVGLADQAVLRVLLPKTLLADRRIDEVLQIAVVAEDDKLGAAVSLRLTDQSSVRALGPLLI